MVPDSRKRRLHNQPADSPPLDGRAHFKEDYLSANFERRVTRNVHGRNERGTLMAQVLSFVAEWKAVSSDLEMKPGWKVGRVNSISRKVWYFRAGVHLRVAYCIGRQPDRLVLLDACQRESLAGMLDYLRESQVVKDVCDG